MCMPCILMVSLLFHYKLHNWYVLYVRVVSVVDDIVFWNSSSVLALFYAFSSETLNNKSRHFFFFLMQSIWIKHPHCLCWKSWALLCLAAAHAVYTVWTKPDNSVVFITVTDGCNCLLKGTRQASKCDFTPQFLVSALQLSLRDCWSPIEVTYETQSCPVCPEQ